VAGTPSAPTVRTGRSDARRYSSAKAWTWRRRLSATAGIATVAVLLLNSYASAQAPGRYVQRDLVVEPQTGSGSGQHWKIRVDSVDVFADRSFGVNLIVTNEGKYASVLAIDKPEKIHLVSDSLERVAARGKPEGQWVTHWTGGIQLLPNDSIKMGFRFPAFQAETKTVNLMFYEGAANQFRDLQIRNISLFADR